MQFLDSFWSIMSGNSEVLDEDLSKTNKNKVFINVSN